jgi:hypothetical protein
VEHRAEEENKDKVEDKAEEENKEDKEIECDDCREEEKQNGYRNPKNESIYEQTESKTSPVPCSAANDLGIVGMTVTDRINDFNNNFHQHSQQMSSSLPSTGLELQLENQVERQEHAKARDVEENQIISNEQHRIGITSESHSNIENRTHNPTYNDVDNKSINNPAQSCSEKHVIQQRKNKKNTKKTSKRKTSTK